MPEHAQLIMKWRNDPTTLSMFYHQNPKVMPDFYEEYVQEYFVEKDYPAIFISIKNEYVAFFRFNKYLELDFEGNAVDISINVRPDMRKKGVGTKSLLWALDYLRERGASVAVAEVKRVNTASINLFKKAGFKIYDELDKLIEDTTEVVPIVRLVLYL